MLARLMFMLGCLLSTIGLAAGREDKPPGAVMLRIEGVAEPIRQGLLDVLDLARYEDRDALAPVRFRQLLAATPAAVRAELESYGYYSAEVLATTRDTSAPWTVLIRIDPGPAVTVATHDLKVQGPGERSRGLRRALAAFAPAPGDRLDHVQYEASKRRVEDIFRRLGYFDARTSERSVTVDPEAGVARITLHWDSGPRYRFGEITISGSQIDPAVIGRFAGFKPGRAFNQDVLIAFQEALAGSGYFSRIDVTADPEAARELQVPIKAELAPALRTRYSGGIGVDADYGAGVRAGMRRRWVNRAGHAFDLETEIAQKRNLLSFEYRIPWLRNAQSFYQIGLVLADEDTEAVQSRSTHLSASAVTPWNEWALRLSLNALSSDFVTGQTRDIPPQTVRSRVDVLYPEIAVERVFARNRIRPRDGASLRLRLRGSVEGAGSDVEFLQTDLEARWIIGLGDVSRLLLRGQLGYTEVSDVRRLPPELRFYAGGDSSVRGYDFRGIGERDAEDTPIGGENLVAASIEFERPFRPGWSWAVFADAGDAFNGTRPDPRLGAGLGLRWLSPVGPVRVDLAHGFDEQSGRGVAVYLSAGPDL